jgi:hypothetical protein
LGFNLQLPLIAQVRNLLFGVDEGLLSLDAFVAAMMMATANPFTKAEKAGFVSVLDLHV